MDLGCGRFEICREGQIVKLYEEHCPCSPIPTIKKALHSWCRAFLDVPIKILSYFKLIIGPSGCKGNNSFRPG